MRRIASSLIIVSLLLSFFAFAIVVQAAKAQSGNIVINPDGSISSPVPANITTSDNVTYNFTDNNYLTIVVNRSNIIINGRGRTLEASAGDGLSLLGMNNVTIENVTVSSYYGIYLQSSSGNVLSGNNITNNLHGGIGLQSSSNNTIVGNNIENNEDGISLISSSSNSIIGNNITANNNLGIDLYDSSSNSIYHNNFVSNQGQVGNYDPESVNAWDDGYPSGGNYWSDYLIRYPSAVENDGSAIWNTPYAINSVIPIGKTDMYPLMGQFEAFSVGTWNNVTYSVDIVSNSTLGNFSFNSTARTLSSSVTGVNGTMGFCRVTIPHGLMWTNNDAEWAVTVDGTLIDDRTVLNDTSNTYIYFTYPHSTQSIQIQSTGAVPEFQPFMLMPLFMIITLFGAMILQRKRKSGKESIARPNSPVI